MRGTGLKILIPLFILMPISILLAFLYAPSAEILGHTSRIIYFHVPCAWISVLAFIVSGIYAILFLFDKNKKFHIPEEKAYNSARIGMLFTILTVITGSLWAKLTWGSFWNWDPRETSIVILLLIYTAYFSLRSSVTDEDKKARISSVYLILAMFTVPFFIFIIPRLYPSLHPDPVINADRKIHLDYKMRTAFFISVISFTFLYAYLFNTLNRISALIKKIEDKND
jgi:heme exporter protein C